MDVLVDGGSKRLISKNEQIKLENNFLTAQAARQWCSQVTDDARAQHGHTALLKTVGYQESFTSD